MWADVAKKTTREAAHTAATKYRTAIKGTELDDDTSDRWAALCKEKSWEVSNAAR